MLRGDLMGSSLYSDFIFKFRFIVVRKYYSDQSDSVCHQLFLLDQLSLLKQPSKDPSFVFQGAQTAEEIIFETALIGIAAQLISPNQLPLLSNAFFEAANKPKVFASLDTLSMWKIIHKLALIQYIPLLISSVTVRNVSLELSLVIVSIAADETAFTAHLILQDRSL